MADTVDRADDRVTAFDHAVNADQGVLLAAVVVHEFGSHARCDATQVVDGTAAAADVEDAACNGGLDGLVAGVGTRARRRAIRRPHALLPAGALKLLLETLAEEKATDEKLTMLAEQGGNQKAARQSKAA